MVHHRSRFTLRNLFRLKFRRDPDAGRVLFVSLWVFSLDVIGYNPSRAA